jgi:2-aminomuconate deaminase
MATIKTFQELEIWQLANDLSGKVFELSQTDLLSKDYGLKNQMNRATGSICDNIAEGFGRGGRNEFIQFLSIARASTSEIQSQLIRCLQRNYIDKAEYDALFEFADIIGKKIGAFIQYLNTSTKSGVKFQNREPNEKRETRNITTRNDKQETINTINAAKPLGAYPHARPVGNLLFLSGIGSRSAVDNAIPGLQLDENGNIIKYDIALETHQVMANVKAVLEASGSSWDKIVDVTVFLTNMKKDFPTYNQIYAEYFSNVQACRTTVEIKSLPTPICIELKVIATID